MKLLAGYATDVGRVREGNEDAFVVDRQLALFAVADGMGGHLGGEVASSTAIESLRAAMASGATIEEAVHRANAAVFERAGHDDTLTGMGTTLTAVTPTGPAELLIGHVGDSRAYIVRGDELRRITEDHSLVEELVREGRITEEQAAVHPQRHIITRTVGVDPEVDVDLYTLEVVEGDRILICSDGLTTMIDEPAIATILRDSAEPQTAAEQLVDAALAAGGTDNVTTVVVDVRVLGDRTEVEARDLDEATALLPAAEPVEPVEHAAIAEEASGAGEAPRPSRTRRVGRAAFWTAVTVVPIAAVGAIGYAVYRNDPGPTTTVPVTTVPATTTTPTSTPPLPTTTAPASSFGGP